MLGRVGECTEMMRHNLGDVGKGWVEDAGVGKAGGCWEGLDRVLGEVREEICWMVGWDVTRGGGEGHLPDVLQSSPLHPSSQSQV